MTLAHAGGSDDLAVLLVPLALAAPLLWRANRFGNKEAESDGEKAEAER